MIVLAFDTALGACSAAIVEAGRVLARAFEPRVRGHAEVLVPMIERVRAEACLDYQDLDRLAVTVGPGTFTGLRVGLSTARGLALACAKPLVGLTTLEVVAAAALGNCGEGHLSAVFDARRGQVYAQSFGAGLQPLNAPAVLDLADLAHHLPPGPGRLVGGGAALAAEALLPRRADVTLLEAPGQPDAAVAAVLAAARALKGDQGPPRPLYLRPPDAKLPRRD